ncbi:LPS export ABC transporter periplasmic protein LptC [Marivirga lumbricoides]|uniref:LPS export ABC transporter periplasmic protein LptC n=1 Tax=Marivirga lumbricoides TaxID=1046115 RepID=A0ABQ1MEE2_9BACT|nr:LPS export ABC transporter periplasmic protein LptC [Marivirga lumbricoides]
MKKIFIILLSLLIVSACEDDNAAKKEFEAFTGPIMEVDSVTILYSDSAVVRVKVNAPKQMEFENGDKEFPNTIFIEFFEPDGTLSSTLEAKTAYYTKETNTYKAEGDVEVIGYLEPQKMNSEELYWAPEKEEIYTEKFVRIETEDQISTGTGLTAKQDFSSYRILNPSGTIYLEEQNSNEPDNRNIEDINAEDSSSVNPVKQKPKPNLKKNNIE